METVGCDTENELYSLIFMYNYIEINILSVKANVISTWLLDFFKNTTVFCCIPFV